MSEFTSKAYTDSLAEGKIQGSKCTRCGSIHLPPRSVCPKCGGAEMEWAELSGSGVIKSYTVIHIPLSTMVGRTPYTLAVVRLDDGPSVSGLVLGIDNGEAITVGSRVKAEFVKEGEKTSLCFRLV